MYDSPDSLYTKESVKRTQGKEKSFLLSTTEIKIFIYTEITGAIAGTKRYLQVAFIF